MKIVCISASNVVKNKDNSATTRVCRLIQEQLTELSPVPVEVKIIPLVEHDLKPCIMCADCQDGSICSQDQAFNQIYSELVDADGIFVVTPHYAPFPSKLMILCEKFEELCYLAYCSKTDFALSNKLVALIGHGGGGGEKAREYYQSALVDPLASVFRACRMEVIGASDSEPNGIAFGVTGMQNVEGTVLPNMVHDWNAIANLLQPLTLQMVKRLTI